MLPVVNVSEVAALVGEHKFLSVAEARARVLRRPTARPGSAAIQLQPLAHRAAPHVNGLVGLVGELEAVRRHRVPNPQASRARRFGDFILRGAVDGWDAEQNQVIEIKTRHKHQRTQLFPHERVQVQAYMALFGAPTTRVIQNFPHGQVHQSVVAFDRAAWSRILARVQAALSHTKSEPTCSSNKS